MNEELDYAQMLEIPVSTVSVVRKRSLFSRKRGSEDLKDRVVESVNERVGEPVAADGYVAAEDLTAPVAVKKKGGTASKILLAEAAAACLIAAGIFVTNVLVKDTVINTFMGSLVRTEEQREAAYNTFKLTPVVSDLSDAEIAVTSDGVIHFTEQATVYPVCDGEVASITQSNGLYTVKIAHTSKFASVVTGLDTVYAGVGEKVKSNLPFAYSKGESEVRVSMFDGETQLNCYTLSGAVPVWNT